MSTVETSAVLAAHPLACPKHLAAILIRTLASAVANDSIHGPTDDVAVFVLLRAASPSGDAYYLDDPINRSIAPHCPGCARATDVRTRTGDFLAKTDSQFFSPL